VRRVEQFAVAIRRLDMPQHAWVDGNLTVHDWLATVPNVPPVVDLAYQPVAKVIRAAGEQPDLRLRRSSRFTASTEPPVSLRWPSPVEGSPSRPVGRHQLRPRGEQPEVDLPHARHHILGGCPDFFQGVRHRRGPERPTPSDRRHDRRERMGSVRAGLVGSSSIGRERQPRRRRGPAMPTSPNSAIAPGAGIGTIVKEMR